MSRLVCYTAIFGGYNILQPHPKNRDVDWVAFVDEESAPTSRTNWDVRVLPSLFGMTPRACAKRLKLLPAWYLPGHDRSVWVDGTVRVDSPSFPEEAMEYVNDSGLALWRHPDRDCIYDEAVISSYFPKYAEEPCRAQVEHYRKAGYPAHAGLWAGGILARDHTVSVHLMDRWMAEVDRWSIQDQLSLPYALWLQAEIPGEFPDALYRNQWLTVLGHNPNA